MALAHVGQERVAQRSLVKGHQPAAAEIDAERLHHGAGATGIGGMADGARRRPRQTELLLDDAGKVRSDQHHRDENQAHQRYPFTCSRKVMVGGAPVVERRTQSARTSRCGITNQAAPPHTPRLEDPPPGGFTPSMAETMCTPRKTSTSACSQSAWPALAPPLPGGVVINASTSAGGPSGGNVEARAGPA